MRVEKDKLPWKELRFESKIQFNQLFNAWCLKVMEFLGSQRGYEAGVKKTVMCSRLLYLTRNHYVMELLEMEH